MRKIRDYCVSFVAVIIKKSYIHSIYKLLLAAVIISMTNLAYAAIPLAGDAVQFYGQAAGYMIFSDGSNGNKTASAASESRVGFRGVVEFENMTTKFIWQVEGGDANNGAKSGQLGGRDTYLGLDFDGIGQIKFGRQLIASYTYVDWPHSNPGLGNVFDWNNDLGAAYEDRADGVFRFDSANWGGFGLQATMSGMSQDIDRAVTSVMANFKADVFSVHGGFYHQGEYETQADEKEKFIIDGNGVVVANPEYVLGGQISTTEKQSYYLLGGTANLDALTLAAAYKSMEKGEVGQDAFSFTAQYQFDDHWLVKTGYAVTGDADDAENTGDKALTLRLGYLLPNTYLYTDLRNYKFDNADDWDSYLLVGAEYYF